MNHARVWLGYLSVVPLGLRRARTGKLPVANVPCFRRLRGLGVGEFVFIRAIRVYIFLPPNQLPCKPKADRTKPKK
jgi:hypothetical protein